MKSGFVIRNLPAYLLTSQDWISDQARRLYLSLLKLADVHTGRLFIPGRGWIRLRTVEQKAGMCARTRKKYMRELRILGGVSIHRDYVTRTIHGRKRKVLGRAQITVLPLTPPNSHEHKGSTTVQKSENVKPEPQDSVSTTVQSTTVQGENSLLGCNSCTVQEMHHQYLSKPPISGPGCSSASFASQESGGGDVAVPGSIPYSASSSKSTTAKPRPDDDDVIEQEKIETLYRDHPQFIEACRRIVLNRAQNMGKNIASPERYVRGALPSLLLEPDLITEILFALKFETWAEAKDLHDAAMQTFVIAQPFDFETARLDPDCLESFLELDGTTVLVFKYGMESFRPGASEPEWHPF